MREHAAQRQAGRTAVLCMVLAMLAALPALGQGGGVVVINPERLFDETLYGQRIQSEVEGIARRLAAENRRIERELLSEEQDLTEKRAQMDPTEFRELADAFDEKVERIREEQDRKSEGLRSRQDTERQRFLATVQPILGAIMRDTGAAVMLDRRGVFLSAQGVDVTDRAIARIDATLDDGQDAPGNNAPQSQDTEAGTDGGGLPEPMPEQMQEPTPETTTEPMPQTMPDGVPADPSGTAPAPAAPGDAAPG